MPDRSLSITITTGTIVKTLLVLAGAWLIYTLIDLILVILTAIVIASAIEPAARWFTARKVPRVIAVLIVFLSFLAVVFGIFYSFLPVFLSEVVSLFSSLSAYADAYTQSSSEVPLLGATQTTGFAITDLVTETRAIVQEFSNNAFSAASTVFGGVLSLILIIVFSFYFAMQEKGIEEFLAIITPADYEQYVVEIGRASCRERV